MLKNYFLVAWRNLVKYRFISAINLLGLTIGVSSCLLILTYVCYETSFDQYNEHADRVYRLTRDLNNENGDVSMRLATIAAPFGNNLQTAFPEIEKMTRLMDNGSTPFHCKDKVINEQNVFFADENIFDIFSIHVLQGDPKKALTDPLSIMITEEIAHKYFGDEDPVGKTIRTDDNDLKVTGVYESFPPNAHIHPAILVSFNTLHLADYGWNNNIFLTYVLLPEHLDPRKLASRFPAFIDEHMPHNGHRPSKFTTLHLQKLTDIHLYSHQDNEPEPTSDISRIYIFVSISFFVLLIACINYMNLSTARSAIRAREIGIRKVIGAGKKGLAMQFLGESIIIATIAVVLSLAVVWSMLPWLNTISGQQVTMQILFHWYIIVPLMLTPVMIGVLSGIYPALLISSFQPIKALKGSIRSGGNLSFQKVLVVFQFTISIILLITTTIVSEQLHFLRKNFLGYDKEQVVVVAGAYKLGDRYDAFKNELLSSPSLKMATRSSRIPTGRLLDDMNAYVINGKNLRQVNTEIKYVAIDDDFIGTYGIKLVAGRDFSKQVGEDTLTYILNEAAVRAIGWKADADAIDQPLQYGDARGHVIGVVKDFNFESMHQQIAPLILKIFPPGHYYLNNLSVKIDQHDPAAAIDHLEATWKKFLPGSPFEYYFLDEKYNALYLSEQRQGTIFFIFAGIAIFIACMGLFGLSSFAISQRVTEIAIRKVLGADVRTIVLLLSQNFMKLVVIAGVIACPIAWWLMDRWLRDFAFHTSIHWWMFGVSGLMALVVAMTTISTHAIKAATANPIRGLRDQ